ncbi:MAG: PFL_4669 family integrating conjugative element protein [Candidatus Thiodiazotropha lotti]
MVQEVKQIESDVANDDEINRHGFELVIESIDTVEPTSPDNTEIERPTYEKTVSPGRLKTTGSVVIHTRAAHELFYGRKGDSNSGINRIVGLTLFATNANNLSLLCKRDDPYAEAVLIKIEELFSMFEEDLSKKIIRLKQILDGMGGVVIDFHESIEPVSIPLEFGTPYGFIAARNLSQYDKLVTLAYSAKQTGLIVQSDWHQYVVKTRTRLRHIFQVSTRYRYGGATRDDIAANNAIAREVIEKYGDLSSEILNRNKRAQYVPHEQS